MIYAATMNCLGPSSSSSFSPLFLLLSSVVRLARLLKYSTNVYMEHPRNKPMFPPASASKSNSV